MHRHILEISILFVAIIANQITIEEFAPLPPNHTSSAASASGPLNIIGKYYNFSFRFLISCFVPQLSFFPHLQLVSAPWHKILFQISIYYYTIYSYTTFSLHIFFCALCIRKYSFLITYYCRFFANIFYSLLLMPGNIH